MLRVKWAHVICVLLWLAYFTHILSSGFIHVVTYGRTSFLLRLSHSLSKSIIRIHHIFFLHLPFEGCSCCGTILATVNNAAVNMGVRRYGRAHGKTGRHKCGNRQETSTAMASEQTGPVGRSARRQTNAKLFSSPCLTHS